MTSQKDQIQSLIADIEQILGAPKPRKPCIRASELETGRQALVQVQNYLKSLQQTFEAPGGWGPVDPNAGQLPAPSQLAAPSDPMGQQMPQSQPYSSGPQSGARTDARTGSGNTALAAVAGDSPENVLQALLTEMKFLKSSALQPLRLELDGLRSEREALQNEVKALSVRRQASSEAANLEAANLESIRRAALEASQQSAVGIDETQFNQFLVALMERLQENLSIQVRQTLNQLELDHAEAIAKLSAAAEAESIHLQPSEPVTDQEVAPIQPNRQMEELHQLQSRSDQLLVNIDATLQRMFETLQRNIDSYQISLNEGLDNMHSLGRQGEVILRSLVDHLTQQLGPSIPPEPAYAADLEPPSPVSMPSRPLAATNTVASLNEILPAGRSYQNESTNSETSSSENTESTILQPEDFIRADGTIDLDRMNLDIDRSDHDPTLSADELMIDAATADAQIAATEADDPAIEAKVTPTADAAYLAGLTLADLTLDAALADLDLTDLDLADLDSETDFGPEPESNSSDLAAELTPPSLPKSEQDFQSAEEMELADVLPDLGPNSKPDLGFDDDEINEISSSDSLVVAEDFEAEEVEPVVHLAEAHLVEDSLSEENLTEDSLVEENLTEENLTEENLVEKNLSENNLTKDDSVEENITEAAVVETEPNLQPESALVPDIPDTHDEPSEALPPGIVAPLENADESAEALPDQLPNHLLNELETDSQTAERIALEANEAEPEVLVADLEEAVVFEAEAPLPTTLSTDSLPLDSSAIPDRPTATAALNMLEADPPIENEDPEEETVSSEIFVDDPLEASLETEDNVGEAADNDLADNNLLDDPTNLLNPEEDIEVAPPLPPADFDDDLDFYSTSALDQVIDPDMSEFIPTESTEPFYDALEGIFSEIPELSAEPTGISSEVSDPVGLTDLDALDALLDPDSSESSESLESINEPVESNELDETDELPPITAMPVLEPSASATTLADPPVIDSSAIESFVVEPPAIDSPGIEPFVTEPPTLDLKTDLQSAPKEPVDPFVTAELDRQPILDQREDGLADPQLAEWFLGIDLGTTGLSAVLINQLDNQVFPLCWNVAGDDQTNRFRLPAVVQINPSAQATQPAQPLRSALSGVGVVGPLALQQGDQLLRNLKPLLKVGIPRESSGEPFIQWSDHQALPLRDLQAALSDLFKTLSAEKLSCRAIDLKSEALKRALADLKGVIVGYPNNWPDTYSFNIREAVLASGMVARPDQVCFVEEAIAALLSALSAPNAATDQINTQQPGLYNCNWSGGTVVISAGATLTESAVVTLPDELDQLSYQDFALRSFTYAGDGLDQDIICQLLHLPIQDRLEQDSAVTESAVTEAPTWQSLGLDQLSLPRVGEADRPKRHRLRQRLNSSALGRELLAAARSLKVALQEDSQYELTLGDQQWVIKRKDLESKIFVPYIQRINRQINSLLAQKSLSAQLVNQVVCTGGSASLWAIARWLRQKFPNATIIQDTYSGEYSNSCSRVAYGLANLCNYPQILDQNRHQYSDYFLLLELLRALPDQPLPAGGILHLLEQRGINTRACQSHILALIEGHLPQGLVPTEGDRPMISAHSSDTDYQRLAELPLFKKQGGQIYIADVEQGKRLHTYLDDLIDTKSQALKSPLAVELTAQSVTSRP